MLPWNRKMFPGTNLQDLNLDWIIRKISALRGGRTGQYLYKKSDTDFDFGWKAGGSGGENGYTFTPSVSAEGVISWTNDGDLPNPEPVNIKGPSGNDGSNGATFTPYVSSVGVISWTNDSDLPNPEPVNIKGPQGENADIVNANIGMFERFAVIGDSFASGTIFVSGVNNTKYPESWPQVLARKRGNRCRNYSLSGFRCQTFLDSNNANYSVYGMGAVINDINAGNLPGLYLMTMGINDANNDTSSSNIGSSSDVNLSDYTQNGNTFWGRYCRIIQHIQSINPNAKIICCGFKRNYVSSLEQAYINYNAAIRSIATFLSLPYINPENDDFFASDYYLNNMVNGHPTAPIYSGFADAMDRLIGHAIENNLSYFANYLGSAVASKTGYFTGDSIIHETPHNWCMLAGMMSNARTLRFLIPLSMPVLASAVSLSGKIITHITGMSGTTITIGNDTTFPNTVSYTITPYGIGVQMSFESDFATSQSLVIVQPNQLDIAFS